MSYGHFSEDGYEYIITRFDTPKPWINCISNGEYCAIVSHTGGGYSFLESPGYHRITRAYPPEMGIGDRPGRYLYIKDKATGEYWSPAWQPVQRIPTWWRACHGLGYTRIASETLGVRSEVLYFVPVSENAEVWRLVLKNPYNLARDLVLYPYVEWCLGNYAFDLMETAFSGLFNQVEEKDGVILASKNIWNVGYSPQQPQAPWGKVAFMASSAKSTGFETNREKFIGVYRSTHNPIALERGVLTGTANSGHDSCGVLQIPILLGPNEEKEILVVVGASGSKEKAFADAERLRKPEFAVEEWEKLRAGWREYVGKITVDSPDPELDPAVNVWTKYQARYAFDWTRMSSYYIGGGTVTGFRDRCQDSLGVLPMEPQRVRARLLDLAVQQFRDGSVIHRWDPVLKLGPKTGHYDDPLWLVLTATSYLRETGDMGLLDEVKAYFDEGEDSLYGHLKRAVAHVLAHRGSKGIPLMGDGDWNSGLDQVGVLGKGESLVTAGLLGLCLKEMALLAQRRGDETFVQECSDAWEMLSKAINEEFWEGEWYARATTDDGRFIGSKEEGRVFLNAQTWPILSGMAPRERAEAALGAVKKTLDTPHGPALFHPAYSPDPRIGVTSMLPKGAKINGAVSNQAVAWLIMAEAMMGRGQEAYDYYRKASFICQSKEVDVYQAEPYVYAEFVHGPESPCQGRGEFTWATGAAAWMLKVYLEWIIGLRPDYEGLLVDPCIPPKWTGFGVKRHFRGAEYDIKVENPDGVSWGVSKITIDGEEHTGQILPVMEEGSKHEVIVVMGKEKESETT